MAHSLLRTSLRQDPSLARRLGGNIPVTLSHDGSEFALALASKLAASPRFDATPEGLALEIATTSLCLRDSEGAVLSCYTPAPDELDPAKIAIEFQRRLFGIGVDLSKAQLSALMGASVVLRSQSYGSENALPNF